MNTTTAVILVLCVVYSAARAVLLWGVDEVEQAFSLTRLGHVINISAVAGLSLATLFDGDHASWWANVLRLVSAMTLVIPQEMAERRRRHQKKRVCKAYATVSSALGQTTDE